MILCTYVNMLVSTYVRRYLCIYVGAYVCMFVFSYIYVCTYVFIVATANLTVTALSVCKNDLSRIFHLTASLTLALHRITHCKNLKHLPRPHLKTTMKCHHKRTTLTLIPP